MYNDRRYSLARYSANQGIKAVELAASFSETMGAVAGPAVPVGLRARFAETLRASALGTITAVSAFQGVEGLSASAAMSADVISGAAFSSALQSSVRASMDIHLGIAITAGLASRAWGSKNIPESHTCAGRLACRAEGVKNIPASLGASEVLTSMLEATSQTTERTTLQLTIPPGGELRIDSELFAVLLNGVNALHTQSGDWINISRELLRLIIESASGGQLRGQLIYTERYL